MRKWPGSVTTSGTYPWFSSFLVSCNPLSTKSWLEQQALEYRIHWEIYTPFAHVATYKWENWNHLFCRNVSLLTALHCQLWGWGQGMKQNYLYLWYPFFELNVIGDFQSSQTWSWDGKSTFRNFFVTEQDVIACFVRIKEFHANIDVNDVKQLFWF